MTRKDILSGIGGKHERYMQAVFDAIIAPPTSTPPRRRVCLPCGGEGGTMEAVHEDGRVVGRYRTCRRCGGRGWREVK